MWRIRYGVTVHKQPLPLEEEEDIVTHIVLSALVVVFRLKQGLPNFYMKM